MNFLLIKSKIKKWVPDIIYNYLYLSYKYLNLYVLGKKQNINLVKFTKLVFKQVVFEDTSFKVLLDPKNGLVDQEIFMRGVWEPEILEIIKKNLKKDSICLDVGANIGQHTLYMSQIAYKGKVYAFEPLKRLVSQIKSSVLENNILNVEVLPFGLSNTEEKKSIYLDNLNIGRTTFDVRKEASSIEIAEVKIFDEWWSDRSEINFIKMDVEGYEYYALQGMKKNLFKYHPILLVEFTPIFYNKMNINPKDILSFLMSYSYRVYDIEFGNTEVNVNNMEAFLERNKNQTNILCVYER